MTAKLGGVMVCADNAKAGVVQRMWSDLTQRFLINYYKKNMIFPSKANISIVKRPKTTFFIEIYCVKVCKKHFLQQRNEFLPFSAIILKDYENL